MLQVTSMRTELQRRVYKIVKTSATCGLCAKQIDTGELVTKGIPGDSWAPVCKVCRPISARGTDPSSQADTQGFDSWAIVEIMGRQKLAGKVSEQLLAGALMLRIDVPATEDIEAFTQLLSSRALYRVTPVAEHIARAAAARIKANPIVVYGINQQIAIETHEMALRLPVEHDPEDYEPRDPDPEYYGPPDPFDNPEEDDWQ